MNLNRIYTVTAEGHTLNVPVQTKEEAKELFLSILQANGLGGVTEKDIIGCFVSHTGKSLKKKSLRNTLKLLREERKQGSRRNTLSSKSEVQLIAGRSS